MDPALAFRLAAAGFVATAVVVAALGQRASAVSPPPPADAPAATLAAVDPHQDALRHCQRLGAAGAEDPECLAAWAQQRDRFLGRPAPTQAR
ncbi:putative entry exclusion protein TrbK-alt [Caulobacter flavus]|uniref:putative entry exclusion protein TrbK-alt n=1 Tax=Caulobacter flavus TaxID=1679497 RepID=UPI00196BA7C6|nr:putative entry exclusion protein TrbK-alt [Caulobacter flavus]